MIKKALAWDRGPNITKFVLVLTPGLLAKKEGPCGYLYSNYFKEKTLVRTLWGNSC